MLCCIFLYLSFTGSLYLTIFVQQVFHEIEEKAELILDERGKTFVNILSLWKYHRSEIALLEDMKALQ
jgi:hypothetical protein